jgi:predicted nuclease of predicted toxin-antitoxin system
MKILVDECLPAHIKNCLSPFGHECKTVREVGFGSKKNGELIALADGEWDVLLTNDRNVKFQQNMTGRKISILVLYAKSNRLKDMLPLIPACAQALLSIQSGQVVEVGPASSSA